MRISYTLRMKEEAWAKLLEMAKAAGYRGRGQYVEALMEKENKDDDRTDNN